MHVCFLVALVIAVNLDWLFFFVRFAWFLLLFLSFTSKEIGVKSIHKVTYLVSSWMLNLNQSVSQSIEAQLLASRKLPLANVIVEWFVAEWW